MIKSETLSYIKAYLDGDTAVGNIIPLRSVLESAIKYLSEPSLPSDLDEAAEDMLDDAGEKGRKTECRAEQCTEHIAPCNTLMLHQHKIADCDENGHYESDRKHQS